MLCGRISPLRGAGGLAPWVLRGLVGRRVLVLLFDIVVDEWRRDARAAVPAFGGGVFGMAPARGATGARRERVFGTGPRGPGAFVEGILWGPRRSAAVRG